jgi:antitoxin PrlF
MIVGRITAKAQTTIPVAVRRALGLRPGDRIAYELAGGRVIMTRVGAAPDDPFATFSEWASEADAEAYAEL